jgi:hypothetical protein
MGKVKMTLVGRRWKEVGVMGLAGLRSNYGSEKSGRRRKRLGVFEMFEWRTRDGRYR